MFGVGGRLSRIGPFGVANGALLEARVGGILIVWGAGRSFPSMPIARFRVALLRLRSTQPIGGWAGIGGLGCNGFRG